MESTNQEETINELKAADSGEEWEPLIARLEADPPPPPATSRSFGRDSDVFCH